MTPHFLFCPLIAMFGLFMVVLLTLAGSRLYAIRTGRSKPGDFQSNAATRTQPTFADRVSRNYANLFEAPIFFYLVCLLIILSGLTDKIFFYLAWSYVALRVMHTFIHISYNYIPHRFAAFLLSNIVLVIMWVNLVVRIIK